MQKRMYLMLLSAMVVIPFTLELQAMRRCLRTASATRKALCKRGCYTSSFTGSGFQEGYLPYSGHSSLHVSSLPSKDKKKQQSNNEENEKMVEGKGFFMRSADDSKNTGHSTNK